MSKTLQECAQSIRGLPFNISARALWSWQADIADNMVLLQTHSRTSRSTPFSSRSCSPSARSLPRRRTSPRTARRRHLNAPRAASSGRRPAERLYFLHRLALPHLMHVMLDHLRVRPTSETARATETAGSRQKLASARVISRQPASVVTSRALRCFIEVFSIYCHVRYVALSRLVHRGCSRNARSAERSRCVCIPAAYPVGACAIS